MKLPITKLKAASLPKVRAPAEQIAPALRVAKGAEATPSLAALETTASAAPLVALIEKPRAPAALEVQAAVAERQASNQLFEEGAPSKLEISPPGGTAISSKGGLPSITWPETLSAALEALEAKGYQRAGERSGSTVLRKGKSELTLTPMELASTAGYVAESDGRQHAQLGALAFADKQWKAFVDGYERPLRTYNKIIDRPVLFNRSPSPRDGSPLHGPQDGLKHYIRLGKSLKTLTKKRVKAQELYAARDAIISMLEKAKVNGKLPKHIMLVVEGLDGASKTGNGLTLSRLLEEAGYDVKFKAFRTPTAAERELGPLGRYEEFADPSAVNGSTVWFLDRGYPGDYVFNPNAKLKELAKQADKFEKRLEQQGVLVVKMIFRPSTSASMATFGKRLARAKIAEDLLARRLDLSPEDVASLKAAATLKPGFNDFKSVTVAKEVQKRYDAFAKANSARFKWFMIETADRHEGRLASFDAFRKARKKAQKKQA